MNALEKLFGGKERMKTIRFFLLNPGRVVTIDELAKTLQIKKRRARKEVLFLRSLGLITAGARKDIVASKKRKTTVRGFLLDTSFKNVTELRNVMIGALGEVKEKIKKYVKPKRSLVMVVLGGIFLHRDENPNISSLDVLMIGGNVSRRQLEPFMRRLEIEIGKELSWALLTNFEFQYRLAMHDRFLKDLFDYPHEFLINRIGFVPN